MFYYVILYFIIYYIILHYIILHFIILHYITLYYIILYYIILYYIIVYYIILYYIISYYIISYHIISYYIFVIYIYIISYANTLGILFLIVFRRTWRTFEQNAQPPPDVKKATALVVAGNPEQGPVSRWKLREKCESPWEKLENHGRKLEKPGKAWEKIGETWKIMGKTWTKTWKKLMLSWFNRHLAWWKSGFSRKNHGNHHAFGWKISTHTTPWYIFFSWPNHHFFSKSNHPSTCSGGELVVLRVPLSLDPKDPNAKGNKERIDPRIHIFHVFSSWWYWGSMGIYRYIHYLARDLWITLGFLEKKWCLLRHSLSERWCTSVYL